jgi:hypothetical protein
MMYNNFMLKLTFRAMTKQNSTHTEKILSTQILYTAELSIHCSLLSQHALVYWPPTDYFAFVSTTVVQCTFAKVQFVNLHVQQKLENCT